MNRSKFFVVSVLLMCLLGCSGESEPNTQGQQSASAAAGKQVVAATSAKGAEVYKNYCLSCHNTGTSGAPKLGDVAAWQPRIAKGKALLLEATIAGVAPAMPQRGMCFSCSDDDLAAAVDFMIAESQ